MDRDLQAFRDALHARDRHLDLTRVALLVARLEHPDLDAAPWIDRLDLLARRSRASRSGGGRAAIERLRQVLFEEEALRGNAEDYFDPRNSCLNDVLVRRLGNPITLSVVTMEVGRRAGLEIEGVGLPGHFVVRAHVASGTLLFDPFHGGRVLTEDQAEAVVAKALGHHVTLTETHFAAATKTQIIARMLTNLRSIYVQREEWLKALAVIDRLLLLDDPSPGCVRDRGTVLMKLGHFHLGAAQWDEYLSRCPHARDAERLRGQLRQIRQALASLN